MAKLPNTIERGAASSGCLPYDLTATELALPPTARISEWPDGGMMQRSQSQHGNGVADSMILPWKSNE